MNNLDSEQLRSELDRRGPMKVFGRLLFGLICCAHIAVVLLSPVFVWDERLALVVAIAQIGLTAVCAALSGWPFVLRAPAWATIATVPLATMWVAGVHAGVNEMPWVLAVLASSWLLTVFVLTMIRWLPSVRWRLARVPGATSDCWQGDKRYSLLQLFIMVAAIAVALSLVLQLLPPSWDNVQDDIARQRPSRSVHLVAYIIAAAVIAVVHMVVGILMFATRRWLVWLGVAFCAIAVAVSWATSATLEALLLIGIWLATLVVTLLAARAMGIRLVRQRHVGRHVSGAPLPRTRTQRLICMVQNPAILALLAVSTLHLWLCFSGALLTCRLVLAGYADLNHSGSVVGLDFKSVPAEKLRLAGVGSLRDVTTLNLNDSGISDDELRYIRNLTRLENLYLGSTKITDRGLEHLKSLTRLEVLDLGSTRITDDGLKHLKNLTELRALHVYDTAIGDVGLQHLYAQRELEELSLGATKTTLAGVCHLAQHLDSLDYVCGNRFLWAGESFHVEGGFSPEEMRLLGRLGVKELWFNEAHLTQGASEALADLRSVQEVLLNGVKGTDVAVKHMENMPRLRTLALRGKTTDDRAMEGVANLQQLEHLALCGTAVSEKGFERLSSLSGLRSLQLEGPNVSDAVLPAICRLTKLESLLFECTCVWDVSSLANLPELKELSLWNTPVPNEKIEKLREALPDCAIEAH